MGNASVDEARCWGDTFRQVDASFVIGTNGEHSTNFESVNVASSVTQRTVDRFNARHWIFCEVSPWDPSTSEAHDALQDAFVDRAADPDRNAAGLERTRFAVNFLKLEFLRLVTGRTICP